MNIEEERKAFEVVCKQKGISTFRTNVAMMFVKGKRMGVGEYFEPAYTVFEFWIQAKQHAEEMAKPEVTLVGGFGCWSLGWCDNQGEMHARSVPFTCSQEEAKVWALHNGYRVIEE